MSKKTSKRPLTRIERVALYLNGLSRPSRMGLNIWISLVVMGVVGLPLVFALGGANGDSTASIVVITTLWFLVYAAGWHALLGFDLDEEHPWQAGRAAVWMLVIGIVMTFLAVLEIVFGLLFGFVL